MRIVFVTGTGTGVGKTWIARGLARAAARRGIAVAAIKPIETGCDPEPRDAIALARAAGRMELASATGLYRARAAVAPYAAALGGEAPPPAPDAIAGAVRSAARGGELAIVEGAGGLLVPLDREHTIADVARALDASLVIVARDGLGVLSDVLATCEAAQARGIRVSVVVLVRFGADDASRTTNARVLAERVAPIAVRVVEGAVDDDEVLADAVERAGVSRVLGISGAG